MDTVSTIRRKLAKLIPFRWQSSEEKAPVQEDNFSDYVMVAAIDFGTTYSGYAFSLKSSPEAIRMNKNWGAEVGFSSYKTPTCVLFDPDGAFKAFGYEAQDIYSQLEGDKQREYAYFERFKMMLLNSNNLNETTTIRATNGTERSALDVLALSLEYFKNHLISAVKQQHEGIDNRLIKWVVTVPTIWKDALKKFMREAALKAGLIAKVDSPQLVISLEPEAASLFCIKLECSDLEEEASKALLKTGTRYLLLDAGGGTVDITSHEQLGDGKVKELHCATGVALGGINVDDNFIKLLKLILGDSFIDNFQRTNASHWLNFMTQFELRKRSAKAGKKVIMEVSYAFANEYKLFTKEGIEEAFRRYKKRAEGPPVDFLSGKIRLNEQAVEYLFRDVTEGIINQLAELLKKPSLSKISHIYLIGGFSESSFLQDAIKAKFGEKVEIVVPKEAGVAVTKGAVMFGHDPDIVFCRISPRSYGVEIVRDFDPQKDPMDKKILSNGEEQCVDVFEPFVKVGQEVQSGYSKTVVYVPVTDSQEGIDIEIYSSEYPEVKYISEAGVKSVGKIVMPLTGEKSTRAVEITMTFGGTEIQVEAIAHPGNLRVENRINFL